MASYTFFFNRQTFDERRSGSSTSSDLLDYLTGDDRRPLNTMSDGDEVFVVGLLDGKVRLGGRLIVDGSPVRRAEAERRTVSEEMWCRDHTSSDARRRGGTDAVSRRGRRGS